MVQRGGEPGLPQQMGALMRFGLWEGEILLTEVREQKMTQRVEDLQCRGHCQSGVTFDRLLAIDLRG